MATRTRMPLSPTKSRICFTLWNNSRVSILFAKIIKRELVKVNTRYHLLFSTSIINSHKKSSNLSIDADFQDSSAWLWLLVVTIRQSRQHSTRDHLTLSPWQWRGHVVINNFKLKEQKRPQHLKYVKLKSSKLWTSICRPATAQPIQGWLAVTSCYNQLR